MRLVPSTAFNLGNVHEAWLLVRANARPLGVGTGVGTCAR